MRSLATAAIVLAFAIAMPRVKASDKWSLTRGDAVTPVASAARTTSSNSGALDASGIRTVSLLLDVTAASGTTPTLNVSVEESDDGTTWRSVGAFAQKTAVSNERKSFAIAGDYYRVVWTVGGTTPSFTFSVTGTSK